jgi:hypothetical protein
MTGHAVVHVHPPARVSARKRAYTRLARARAHIPSMADGPTPATAGTAITSSPPPRLNIS